MMGMKKKGNEIPLFIYNICKLVGKPKGML